MSYASAEAFVAFPVAWTLENGEHRAAVYVQAGLPPLVTNAQAAKTRWAPCVFILESRWKKKTRPKLRISSARGHEFKDHSLRCRVYVRVYIENTQKPYELQACVSILFESFYFYDETKDKKLCCVSPFAHLQSIFSSE